MSCLIVAAKDEPKSTCGGQVLHLVVNRSQKVEHLVILAMH